MTNPHSLFRLLPTAMLSIPVCPIYLFLFLLSLPMSLHAEDPDSIATLSSSESELQTSSQKHRANITPVDIDPGKPSDPIMHYYDKHGNPLQTPVRFYLETDTISTPKAASPYPLYSGFNIGVNFADAIMMATGQKYAGFDIWADVSLHNWFFPTIEAGLGFAKSTPENGNFTYRGKLSPYFKVGLNYNFMYKSNPDYNVFLGLRAGFSPYSYEITDISVTSDYWHQTADFNIPTQHAFSIYGEALVGLKVKIWKFIAMGWTFRYHFKIHTHNSSTPGGTTPGGEPWYIPGYGTNSPVNFTFSLIFSFPKYLKEN